MDFSRVVAFVASLFLNVSEAKTRMNVSTIVKGLSQGFPCDPCDPLQCYFQITGEHRLVKLLEFHFQDQFHKRAMPFTSTFWVLVTQAVLQGKISLCFFVLKKQSGKLVFDRHVGDFSDGWHVSITPDVDSEIHKLFCEMTKTFSTKHFEQFLFDWFVYSSPNWIDLMMFKLFLSPEELKRTLKQRDRIERRAYRRMLSELAQQAEEAQKIDHQIKFMNADFQGEDSLALKIYHAHRELVNEKRAFSFAQIPYEYIADEEKDHEDRKWKTDGVYQEESYNDVDDFSVFDPCPRKNKGVTNRQRKNQKTKQRVQSGF